MAIKVKEMKDDAVVSVSVNKAFYLMMKAILLHLFKSITAEDKEAYLKDIMTKEYKDLDELQRSFHTVTLFLAEVEKQAKDQNFYEEKEILQPGDEGYVEPTQG
jgi:hypothetical protein